MQLSTTKHEHNIYISSFEKDFLKDNGFFSNFFKISLRARFIDSNVFKIVYDIREERHERQEEEQEAHGHAQTSGVQVRVRDRNVYGTVVQHDHIQEETGEKYLTYSYSQHIYEYILLSWQDLRIY